MTEWVQKRFWRHATAVQAGPGAWNIELDGRQVRTPAKASLVLPNGALARSVAEEWAAQADEIDPISMPCTRSANAAIDKVSTQFEEVAGLICEYGNTDLLCYRADGPEGLIQRQAEAWDPLLDWAASGLGAPLAMTTGVIHIAQPANSLEALRARVTALSPFELTAMNDLVMLSGSLIIGLAVSHDVLPAEELWNRSRVDETWQKEQWGSDEEATAMASQKRSDFLHAYRFLCMCRESD